MYKLLSVSPKFVLTILCFIYFSPRLSFGQSGHNIVKINYSYPAPNAIQVSGKTTIGVRYSEAISKSTYLSSAFTVTGTSSGVHSGKVILALDGRTVIFTPDKYFSTGERVTVTISPLKCVSGKSTTVYSFTFQISKTKVLPSSLSMRSESSHPSISELASNAGGSPTITNSSGTLPDDFPNIYITKSNNPAPGNIYLADFKFTHNDSGTYLIIMDNTGNVLYRRSTWPAFAQDFKPQPNGMFTYYDADPYKSKFYGLDSNFNLRDSFEAKNGYGTDSHELIFLPGGGYALLAQVDEMVNLSHIAIDGDTNATVAEGIIQEFDANKNLLFEWKTREHFAFTDQTHPNFKQPFLDFTHCNSLEYDFDSTFLLSSRNLDEVTKIDPETGNIIWRWGGNNNQFKFVNDSLLFSRQHAVRRLANGNITLFDNGTFHNTAQPYSRAVEYRLDEQAKTATKVWEYHHDPEVYGEAMGYVQRLSNGNSLIDWGSCDSVAITEVKPDGSTALEIKFNPGIYSYRAYKYTKDQIDILKGKEGVSSPDLSQIIALEQNFPNPFTNSSTINFKISGRTSVELKIYDALGREIKTLFNGTVDPGSYSAKFDAGTLSNGAYFCKLNTPSTSLTRIMILAK